MQGVIWDCTSKLAKAPSGRAGSNNGKKNTFCGISTTTYEGNVTGELSFGNELWNGLWE
jgi:hypothetical protein